MDRELIEEKLDSLRRCVRRVDEKRVSTVEDLEQDWDTQDILTVNLTRAVQLCVDVAAHLIAETDRPSPETMAKAFDHLQEMGSFRRSWPIGYRGLSDSATLLFTPIAPLTGRIVHSISYERLGDFRAFAHQVMRHLDLSSGS